MTEMSDLCCLRKPRLFHVRPQYYLSATINCLVIMELVADNFLLYIVNKHQCNLFTMCSFANNLFTVTGNSNNV